MNSQGIIMILCVVVQYASSQYNPIVETSLGKIKGSYMSTRLGKRIYAFRGIRYGKSPVGYKRFKTPELIDSWNGTIDATNEGPSCIRLEAVNPSEDCLALNIYTTMIPTIREKRNLPVLVFFPPGAFQSFSAQSYIYGPQYLLDQNVVLVTVNYRIGFLGFPSTGDNYAPGNLGLKDQVLALRFINKHIENFGGDPNSVTIAGYSAGGWSVILHMLSPMSRGLFHKAIAMSTAPISLKPLPTEQKKIAIKQARLLNCPTNDFDKMFQCMMEKPAMDFANTLPGFKEFYREPSLVFSPVVEPYIPGIERFLDAQPLDIIRSKNFYHVPLIIGSNRDEAVMSVFWAIENSKSGNISYFQDLDTEWERLAPICYLYERDTENSKFISNEIRKFYFHNQPVTLANAEHLAKIYSDGIVNFPTHRMANLMAANNREPVYYYSFTYQGRYSHLMYSDSNKPFGVVHFDDLMYTFHISYKFPLFNKDDPEVPLIEKMTAIWENFARTGQPFSKINKYFHNIKWDNLTPKNTKYLDMNVNFTMKTNLNADRYDLWERLFPLPTIKSLSFKTTNEAIKSLSFLAQNIVKQVFRISLIA